MKPEQPGPAVGLIEHAARIIVETRKQPHTAPYHWAAALYEAGMLVSPGTPDAVDPLRQPGIVTVDTNDEALLDRVTEWITDGSGTDLSWRYEVGLVFAAVAALAGRGETP